MNSVHSMTTARRDRLKAELRNEILAAARDLFARQGYESVSIRKIAERCGCAPGTIYLHFEDKDQILSAICAETFAILKQRMAAISKDTGDPLERLRRSGRQYIQFGIDHPYHYIVTFGVAPGTQAGKSDADHQAGMECFQSLRDCVQRCQESGQLRFPDVEEVAQALWATTHGLVMLLITKAGFPFVEQTRLIETTLDMSIEGIRAR